MIDKNDILKFAKHVYTRGQGIPDRRLLHPRRDWTIGLFFFLCLVISGGIISAKLFSEYRNVHTTKVQVDKQIPAYKEQLISTVLEKYRERKDAYDALLAEKENVEPVIEVSVATSTATTTDTTVMTATTTESIETVQDEETNTVQLDAS